MRVHGHVDFKPSPFYVFQAQVGETKNLEGRYWSNSKETRADFDLVMANHRHSVSIPLKPADNGVLARVNNEAALRVMVLCAGDNHGPQDIAFPHQSEVKVNGGEVKANLRGLKNKPGSTRPVDITKELRLKVPHYSNTVELTYALTSKVDGGSFRVSCLHPQTLHALIPPLLIPLGTAVKITSY
jgi:E3 SUMO-protein ligase PIAS1